MLSAAMAFVERMSHVVAVGHETAMIGFVTAPLRLGLRAFGFASTSRGHHEILGFLLGMSRARRSTSRDGGGGRRRTLSCR